MLPIILDLRGRSCLVVGGGPVGRRKAAAVLEAGADVRLICLEPAPADLPNGMAWRTDSYRADHLDGMSLAFAAATPAVNAQVVEDARSRQVWVSSATEPEAGDFMLPAVGGKGRIRIAVSTGGASPVLAAHVRDVLGQHIDEALVGWADVIAEVRDEIRSRLPIGRRRNLLLGLAHPDWLDRIRAEGPAAVRAAMRALVDREVGR
jgi:precorrin-2 dehydrogenase/sirohydrochlorin ferrochelatase